MMGNAQRGHCCVLEFSDNCKESRKPWSEVSDLKLDVEAQGLINSYNMKGLTSFQLSVLACTYNAPFDMGPYPQHLGLIQA
jgi:hypothetical protein